MNGRRPENRSPPQRQRGIAMLVAILLVALATIIAATVAYESAMSARRGTATFSFDEALLVSQGAEALAAYGLRAVRKADPDFTYPAQPWGQPVGPLEVVPGVTLEATLEDMQGRFNLNWLVASGTPSAGGGNSGDNGSPGITSAGTSSLATTTPSTPGAAAEAGQPDPEAVVAFTNLLQLVGIEPKWAELLIDWIDQDNRPQTEGAEDSAYLGQDPPYLAANQYITSASELLALPGFGHDRYVKLAPYVTALPPNSKLNLCSASGFVLDAFKGTGKADFSSDPTSLAKNRAAAGGCFPKKNDYQATFDVPADFTKVADRLVMKSNFFRLSSLVTIGTAEFNLYSLLYRDDQSGFVHPIVRTFSSD